jgi:hypothetical protein
LLHQPRLLHGDFAVPARVRASSHFCQWTRKYWSLTNTQKQILSCDTTLQGKSCTSRYFCGRAAQVSDFFCSLPYAANFCWAAAACAMGGVHRAGVRFSRRAVQDLANPEPPGTARVDLAFTPHLSRTSMRARRTFVRLHLGTHWFCLTIRIDKRVCGTVHRT